MKFSCTPVSFSLEQVLGLLSFTFLQTLCVPRPSVPEEGPAHRSVHLSSDQPQAAHLVGLSYQQRVRQHQQPLSYLWRCSPCQASSSGGKLQLGNPRLGSWVVGLRLPVTVSNNRGRVESYEVFIEKACPPKDRVLTSIKSCLHSKVQGLAL